MRQFQTARLAVLVFLFPGAGSAVADSAAGSALVRRGAQLYAEFCADCHGDDALGGSGPDITRTPRVFVAEAVRGADQMPEIELTEDEIEAVAAHLATLP